ncbi:MAG: tetratricopeptide repeat protein [bacterium]
MRINFKPFFLPIVILAVGAMAGHAQAQWSTVIRSLQPEVRIAEKAATRLVLYHSALKAPLVMTIAQELDSDIFGDREAKRGGNPYRVWVTTEKFWNTPALAEDGGRKFFRESFVKTLRRFRRNDEPNIPAAKPREEFTVKEDSTPYLVQQPLQREAEEEKARIAPDSALMHFEMAGAKAESLANLQNRMAAAGAPRRVEKARSSSRSPAKQDEAARHLKTAATKPEDQPAHPAIDPLPTKREHDRIDSAAIAAAPSTPARFSDSFNETATTDVDSIPHRIGSSPFLLGPFFAALILLSCFVFIISLPATRARIHLWQGNPIAAAKIYESKLQQNPRKMKLYLPLANIYLKMQRKDENAMKIYKTILQLNLATEAREKFTEMVAQKYLAEGRTDAEVIEVLENALKAENRKQSLEQKAKE